MDLYDEMVNAGVPTDNHESDLYVPVNETTTALVKASGRSHSTFVDQRDGKTLMYDIPFAYLPWWRKRKPARP